MDRLPDEFHADEYAVHVGLDPKRRWAAFAHYVVNGPSQAPCVPFVGAASAAPLLDIATAIADASPDRAVAFCERALLLAPKDPSALQTYGDLNLNAKRVVAAMRAYQDANALQPGYFWALANQAWCQHELGMNEDAIAGYTAAIKVNPGMYFAKRRRADLARKRFAAQWDHANRMCVAGADGDAVALMRQAVADYRGAVDTQAEHVFISKARCSASPRIAIFGSTHIFQCRFYRIDQKIDQLAAVSVEPEFFTLDEVRDFVDRMHLFDVAIIYRAPATPEILDALEYARACGVTTFYDIDDLIFDESCYPPTRESLGALVSPKEYSGLLTGRELFHAALAMCDYGIASTPPLQHAMAKVVRKKKCFLHRNALGETHKAAIAGMRQIRPRGKGEPITLIYGSGSKSHNANFQLAAPAILQIMHAYPQVRLKIIGPLDIDPAFGKLEDRIERLPFTPKPLEYWEHLADADINLAPLTAGSFNDGKSEIKWMEAGMLGVPSVVSDTAVYRECVAHNVDGLVARTDGEWFKALDLLVSNPQARGKIAAAARQKALAAYAIEPMAKNLISILSHGRAEPAPRTKPLVLVVNVYYPPQYVGGATRVVEQNVLLAKKRYGESFDIEVFCARDDGAYPGEVVRYSSNGVAVTSLAPFADNDESERSEKTDAMFAELVERLSPDLIHFHCIQRLTASVVDVARRADIPYLVTIHDGWWVSDKQFLIDEKGTPVYESDEWGDPARLTRLRNCLRRAENVLAVSNSIGDLYRSRGVDNIVVCQNGIGEFSQVGPAPAEGPVTFGLLGGIGLAKGSEVLRAALRTRKYDNVRFVVVDHSRVEGFEKIEYWGDNPVTIIGKVSFGKVANIYGRLHGVLNISVCIESFGLVAREAASLGRWVIASDRGGVGEDVTHGVDGFVIDVSTPRGLLDVLDEIERDPARFRAPPQRQPKLRRVEDQVDDLATIYKAVLAKHPANASPSLPVRFHASSAPKSFRQRLSSVFGASQKQ